MSQILETIHSNASQKLEVQITKTDTKFGFCVICHTPKIVDTVSNKTNQPLVLRCVGHNHKSWFRST